MICRGNSGASSRAVIGYPEGDIIGGTRNGRSASTLYQREGISRGLSVIRLPVTVAIRWSSLSIGESDEPMFLIVQTLVRFIPDHARSRPDRKRVSRRTDVERIETQLIRFSNISQLYMVGRLVLVVGLSIRFELVNISGRQYNSSVRETNLIVQSNQ